MITCGRTQIPRGRRWGQRLRFVHVRSGTIGGQPGRRARPTDSTRRENQLLRELVAVYSHLSGLASQDADMEGVVRLVAHRTRAAVVVLGPGQQPLAAAPAGAARAAGVGRSARRRWPRCWPRPRRTAGPMSLPGLGAEPGAIAVAPIMVNHDVVAHLVTVRSAGPTPSGPELDDDLNLLLTEHAATDLRDHPRPRAGGRRGRARGPARELIEGLLLARDRDDGEAERWAGHLGFLLGVEHHVFAVAILDEPGGGPDQPAPDRSRMLAPAERAILRKIPDAIVVVRESEVVAVALVPPGAKAGLDDVRALAPQCRAAIVERYPRGDGGGRHRRLLPAAGGDLPVLRRGPPGHRRRGPDGHHPGVVAYDDLGIHRLLLQVPDLGELRSFATAVLGDLVRDPSRAELLQTLSAWFRTGGSPQRTARALHLHANTVSYRIRRVEEITGLRLDDYQDRLLAQVACEIVEVVGPW